jgi:hypothetical protein
MFSRKHRSTLVLSLALSAGALSLPAAEAAPGRSSRPGTGSVVQTELFTRSLIETVKNLWGLLKDAPPGPYNGQPGGPQGPSNREGTGICPVGKPPNPGM